MAGHDNLHIVREIFAAWNAHDVEGFLRRLDTKTTWESDAFPVPFSGHEGARQFFKLYVTAFPDLHFDIEQILPAGDSHVVVRWRSTGTHHGPLADTPATHRTASNHGCTLMEMKSGKAARAWVFFDNAHLSGRSAFCRGADVRVCWRATHGRLSASVTTASEFHDRVRPMTGGDTDMRCWLKQAKVDKSKL